MIQNNYFRQPGFFLNLFRWTLLSIPVAAITGSFVALFLWLLDKATEQQWQKQWLLYFLPLAGIGIYFIYKFFGKKSEAGNNLIIDEIHEPGAGVPVAMTPLVLLTTIITHLFGGSAGREGTAVQMGGSMAQWVGRWFRLQGEDRKIILQCGVAAGFGAVFGTPVTGAIFALEVISIGRISHKALLPCFVASLLGHIVCISYGIHHTAYLIAFSDLSDSQIPYLHFDITLLLKVIIGSICFGWAGYFFANISHSIKTYSNRFIKTKWLIPVIGGLLVIALTLILGTRDYLGLGVTNPHASGVSIVNAFHEGGATYFSWFWKILFTAITIGTGFKGGEVTPLFFIGATLGNAIAVISGAPIDLMAGLGFIAVFAAATNTPIACTLMGVELFGGDYILYYAVACFIAYYCSGHSGIYTSQRIGNSKWLQKKEQEGKTLKEIRNSK